jgi:hypothetical protein
LLFFEKCILIIDMDALSLDKEGPMNIRQAALGAGLAVLLVFGADAGPAQGSVQTASALTPPVSGQVCDLAGLKETVRNTAQQAGNAVLDAALDAAGEIWARAKQVL